MLDYIISQCPNLENWPHFLDPIILQDFGFLTYKENHRLHFYLKGVGLTGNKGSSGLTSAKMMAPKFEKSIVFPLFPGEFFFLLQGCLYVIKEEI